MLNRYGDRVYSCVVSNLRGKHLFIIKCIMYACFCSYLVSKKFLCIASILSEEWLGVFSHDVSAPIEIILWFFTFTLLVYYLHWFSNVNISFLNLRNKDLLVMIFHLSSRKYIMFTLAININTYLNDVTGHSLKKCLSNYEFVKLTQFCAYSCLLTSSYKQGDSFCFVLF